LLEFLKNLGPRIISWIAKLANKIVNTNTLPKIWRETKVIAILKPNKEAQIIAQTDSLSDVKSR